MLRFVLLLLAVLPLTLLGLLASCSDGKLLVANSLARTGNYAVQADIAYGPHPRQRLDLYLPTGFAAAVPMTLVFIPGGCWGACDTLPKDDYLFIADTFTAQGYAVAILNYRLFPQHTFPDIIGDVAAAVDFLAQRAPALGASDKLVLSGHSAGGHMAALLALDERYLQPDTRTRLQGWIGLAGPYDFLPFTEYYQPFLFAPESRFPESQPVNFVDGSETPALLLYGNADVRVKPRNILSLSARLAEKGVMHQTRCYDGLDHTGIIGALSRPLRNVEPVLADMLAFLQQLEAQQVSALPAPATCGGSPG